MADVTAKALNLCSRLQNAANKLMQGVEELAALKAEKEAAGLILTAAPVEAAIAGTAQNPSSLKHASGGDFDLVVSSGASLKTWLEANNHDDVFSKVRP